MMNIQNLHQQKKSEKLLFFVIFSIGKGEFNCEGWTFLPDYFTIYTYAVG